MHEQAFNILLYLLCYPCITNKGGRGREIKKYIIAIKIFAQKSKFAQLLFRHKHVLYGVISRISNFCQVKSKRGNTSKLTQF